MLYPIRMRFDHQAKPFLGTWGQSAFGKAFHDLHPLSTFRSFTVQRRSTDNHAPTVLVPVPLTADVYNSGIVTCNFFTPYHIDQNDGCAMTHCFYSPPPRWLTQPRPNVPYAVFALGTALFSLSDFPLQINFLANHTFHATGIPSEVPQLVPNSLVNNKVVKTVWNRETIVTIEFQSR